MLQPGTCEAVLYVRAAYAVPARDVMPIAPYPLRSRPSLDAFSPSCNLWLPRRASHDVRIVPPSFVGRAP